jgi:hypothetical protein
MLRTLTVITPLGRQKKKETKKERKKPSYATEIRYLQFKFMYYNIITSQL